MKTKIVLLLLCLTQFCLTQCCLPAMTSGQVNIGQHKQYVPTSWAWMQEKWTGDERPYVKARIELDGALNATKDRGTLLKKYREQFQQKPKDPLALFRWAYAAYWTVPQQHRSELSDVLRAFDRTKSPEIYDYTRIRFLVQVRETNNAKLKIVGLRLVAHVPGEKQNRLSLTNALEISETLQDRKLAVEYTVKMFEEFPKDYHMAATLGDAYAYLWAMTHDAQDAQKGIKAYQSYLAMAPPTQNYRQSAEHFINYLQGEIAKSGKTP